MLNSLLELTVKSILSALFGQFHGFFQNRFMMNAQWFALLCFAFYIEKVESLDSSTADEITVVAYDFRSVAFPRPKKMTCLTWGASQEANVKSLTSRCALPSTASTDTIYDIFAGDKSYVDLFGEWLAQNDFYNFDDNSCEVGQSCNEFKTMFNDLANVFACSQATCNSLPGFAAGPYTYTVCQFDQPRPSGAPYVLSDSAVFACTANSCPPLKPVCFDDSICCNPNVPPDCNDELTTGTCTQTLCDTQPGTYLTKCKKTCNNCDSCKCLDSTTFDCAKYKLYSYCVKYPEQMAKFCPTTCSLCSEVIGSGCALKN